MKHKLFIFSVDKYSEKEVKSPMRGYQTMEEQRMPTLKPYSRATIVDICRSDLSSPLISQSVEYDSRPITLPHTVT